MKTFVLFFLYSLITEGVFGKSVSLTLTEGDSVTLHTGLTEIQKNDEIEWRFDLHRIARIKKDKESPEYDDDLNGRFKGRLQQDVKTGDLTITNIKTTDTGVYKVSNSISVLEESFSVTVVSVDQMHSVLVGEFVTLQTGLTNTQNYDVLRWKFGPQHSTIAEVNIKDRNVSFDWPDKTFKDRLQLDYRTGSLTITNTRTKDSGLYEINIIKSSSYTIQKSYNVTISGEVKSLLVKERDSVKLHTDTEIQYDDSILWMFGDIVIVSRPIYKAKQRVSIYNGPDEIFRDRLKLDDQTGSLTITNITTKHAGLYKLQITTSRHTVNRKFLVNVEAFTDLPSGSEAGIGVGFVTGAIVVAAVSGCVHFCYCRSSVLKRLSYEDKTLPVMKGGSVILETDAKVHRDVLILWVREATVIAEINGGTRKVSIYDDVLNKKLRGRLKLDSQTGSLTIRDFTTEYAGLYTLKMMRGQSVSFKSFTVNLCDTMESVSVMKGDSFTLQSGLTAIQDDDVIQCLYGDKANPIARINGWARESPTYYNEDRFTGRLDMTSETASLTITDSETTDSGLYELHIFTPEKKIARSFSVTVSDPTTHVPFLP